MPAGLLYAQPAMLLLPVLLPFMPSDVRGLIGAHVSRLVTHISFRCALRLAVRLRSAHAPGTTFWVRHTVCILYSYSMHAQTQHRQHTNVQPVFSVPLHSQGMQDGGPSGLPVASTLSASAVGSGSMLRAPLRVNQDDLHAGASNPPEVATAAPAAQQPTWADRTAGNTIPAGSNRDGGGSGGGSSGGGALGVPAAGSTASQRGCGAPVASPGVAAAPRVGGGWWSSQLSARVAGNLGAAGATERVPRGGGSPQEVAPRSAASPPAVVEAMIDSPDAGARKLRRSQSFHQDDSSRRRGGSQDGRGDGGSPYQAPRSQRASCSEAGHLSGSAMQTSGGGAGGDVHGQGVARREEGRVDGDSEVDVAMGGGGSSPDGRLSFKVRSRYMASLGSQNMSNSAIQSRLDSDSAG